MNKKFRPVSAKPNISLSQYVDSNERKMTQDLLVSRYLEQCLNEKNSKGQFIAPSKLKSSIALQSPYASHMSLRDIPTSAFVAHKASKHSNGPHPPKSRRPISAPVYKQGVRSWSKLSHVSDASFTSGSFYSTGSSKSGRQKAVYKRQHHVIRVQAYLNGSRERPVRVTSTDLSQLLTECTQKLGLTSAARKLYLGDGTPVTSEQQLSKDEEVYVSTGEPFKDPYLSFHEREKLRKNSFWTLNGIMMPIEETRRSNRMTSSVSQRMSQLIDSQKRRILVFKNGESFGGVEIVANRFDEFLDDCTKKLGLTSCARYIFDWCGKQVENLTNVPSLDKSLQPSSGPVLGPLWVSKGERFSPKGAHSFLATMVRDTKERISQTNHYLQKLREELEAGMSYFLKEEIFSELAQEQVALAGLEAALPPLQVLVDGLKKVHDEEGHFENPSSYKLQHISEIDANSRLLVSPGVKLQFYINGQKRNVGPIKTFVNVNELKKGSKTNDQTLQKFFDLVNSNENITSLFGITATKVNVKRAFSLDGREVLDISTLSQNHEVWLSLGEGFIPVEYPIVTVNFEKVKLTSLWGWKQIVQKDLWMGADENQTNWKLWQTVPSVPSQCESQEMKLEMSSQEKVAYLNQCSEERLHDNRPYLQSKQDHSLVLYPELVFQTKGRDGDGNSMWGSHIDTWCINQDGTIHNRHFKSLVLGVIDEEIQVLFRDESDKEELLEGALVGLRMKNSSKLMDTQFNGQFCHWIFTSDGYIQPKAFSEYVLTAVEGFGLNDKLISSPNDERSEEDLHGHWQIQSRNELIVTEHDTSSSSAGERRVEGEQKDPSDQQQQQQEKLDDEEEKQSKNFNPFADIKDVYKGQQTKLVILPKFPANHKLAGNQRWALKLTQENHFWKNASLSDKWLQQNLTWPADEHGQMTEIPLEGQLTYGVPKLKWKMPNFEEKTFSAAKTDNRPIKLRILRNGESDMNRAVSIMAADTKNAKKDTDVEFSQFLEKCTDALSLPFAARRLFATDGKEVLSLASFEKDDLVYVSCGENWIDPTQSQAERQKRVLLANLAADIAKIKKYTTLRNCTGYILQSDVQYQESQVFLMMAPEHQNDREKEQVTGYEMMDPIQSDDETELMTSHERTHARLDGAHDEETRDAKQIERQSISHREVLFGVESNEAQRRTMCSYKWLYHDGFIQLKSSGNIVIGVTEANVNQDVVICKRNSEDSNQQWQYHNDGTISLMTNPNLVLTVATPPLLNDTFMDYAIEYGVYDQARLILANRKAVVNGNANQMFWLDEDSGYLYAFAADDVNTELTAANLANVCSYSVFSDTPVHQPVYFSNANYGDLGYRIPIVLYFENKYNIGRFSSSDLEYHGYYFKQKTNNSTTTFMLCEACGRTARAKQKLQRLQDPTEFACCFGGAKNNKLKMKGTFQCLESSIDLSPLQVETTLALWEEQLQNLRNESSARVIAKAITSAQSHPAVRLLVRKNGDGFGSMGALVIGNMLSQILIDCTQKLNLPHAARRLYTMDGELITTMQQLLKPYYPELTYMKQKKKKKKKKLPSRTTIPEQENHTTGNDEIPVLGEAQEEAEEMELFDIEKLDVRIPVDVWVSMGEPFISLDELQRSEILAKHEVNEKDDTTKRLQIQKHRLRHAKGRRMAGYKSDQVDKALKRAWTNRTEKEHQIETSIDQLENELQDLKNSHKDSRAKLLNMNTKHDPSGKLTRKMEKMKLYQLPRAIKLHVFPNGENPRKSRLIHAQSFEQILDNATSRLELISCARRVFTEHGVEIFNLEDITRDQTLCVSCGERFVPFKERRNQVELKAAYSRVNRNHKTLDDGNLITLETQRSGTLELPSTIRSQQQQQQQQQHYSFIHVDSDFDVQNGVKKSVISSKISSRPISARPKSARPISARPESARPISARPINEEEPALFLEEFLTTAE